MKTITKGKLLAIVLATLAMGMVHSPEAVADGYPERPVEVIVPFPPGGTSDLSVRFLADKWSEFLGQPVVILNRPGAGSALGASLVANAEPDGYTLLLGSESPLVVVRLVQPDVEYDIDNFDFLHSYAKGAVFFTTHRDAEWDSLEEFIAAARERPGELTYATHGVGTLSHFIGEVLWREVGIEVTHVPYSSSPEVNTALIGRHVDVAIPPSFGGLAGSDDIQILATTSDERVPFAPDVPTLNDLGYKASLIYRSILVGPAGLPQEVKAKLLEAQEKALEKYGDELRESLVRLELAPSQISGEEAREHIIAAEKWMRPLAEEFGLGKK